MKSMKFRVVTSKHRGLLKIQKFRNMFFSGMSYWYMYDVIGSSDITDSIVKYHQTETAIRKRDMKYLLPLIKKYIERKEKGFEPEVLVEFEVQV